MVEKAFLLGERKYNRLFTNLPISIWELDFTAVKKAITALNVDSPEQVEQHFLQEPGFIDQCIQISRVVAVNEAASLTLESPEPEILENGLAHYMVDSEREIFGQMFSNMLRNQLPFEFEVRLKSANGKYINGRLNANFIPGFEENWAQVLVTIIDTTLLKLVPG